MDEIGPCLICGSTNSAFWGEENGYTAVRCNDCQIVYLSPWPDMTKREDAVKYGQHAGERTLETNARYGGEATISGYLGVIEEVFGSSGPAQRPVRWLDVGCGYGEFIEALSRRLPAGSQLKGCEPNVTKIESARARGLDVESFKLEESDETWDRISLLNVYSHIPDAAVFIAQLRSKLVHGGELILQTGNGGEIARKDFPGTLNFPDHLVFTSEKALRLVLEKVGFEIVSVTRRKSPEPTLRNRARDIAKRVLRAGYNPVNWSGPSRSIWVRARRGGMPA